MGSNKCNRSSCLTEIQIKITHSSFAISVYIIIGTLQWDYFVVLTPTQSFSFISLMEIYPNALHKSLSWKITMFFKKGCQPKTYAQLQCFNVFLDGKLKTKIWRFTSLMQLKEIRGFYSEWWRNSNWCANSYNMGGIWLIWRVSTQDVPHSFCGGYSC